MNESEILSGFTKPKVLPAYQVLSKSETVIRNFFVEMSWNDPTSSDGQGRGNETTIDTQTHCGDSH